MTQPDLSALNTMARSKYKMGNLDVREALRAASLDPKHLEPIAVGDAQAACKKYAEKHHTLFRTRIRD